MLNREDREEVLEALDFISPDEYVNWLTVGTALKTMGFPSETFKQWAARSAKYNERENERKWSRDLKDSGNPDKETNIIKKMAKEGGWRPDPDKGRMDWDTPIETDWTPPNYGKKADTAGNGPGKPVDEQTGKKEQEPMEDEKNAPGAADGQKADFSAIIDKAYRDREKTDYWTRRGLNEGTIDAFQLGYTESQTFKDKETGQFFTAPAVIIPYPGTNGGYYIARSVDGKYFYKPNSGIAGKEPVFLADYIAEEAPCFIVESQIDALSIFQAGGLAAAIGGSGKGKLLELVKKNRPPQPLILAFDNDPQGESNYKSLAEDLDNLKIPYTKAEWTLDEYPKDKQKDANEYLTGNPGQFAADIKSNMKKARKIPLFEEEQKNFDAFTASIFEEKYKLIPSGLPAVDEYLMGGFLPGTLVIIGGPPGSGKTAFSSMLAESMASNGRRFLYLNLEMSREQMYSRSVSRLAFRAPEGIARAVTALDVLQAYKASPDEQRAIKRAAETYRARIAPNLCYNPWTVTSAAAILDKLQEAAMDSKREGKQPPDIALDYLQLVTGTGRAEQAEIIKEVLTGLKQYAISNNAIVFCLTAQSRRANTSEEPAMESGRDSSNIEYSGDTLLQLVPVKNSRGEANGVKYTRVFLHVTKSRFTPASTDKEDGKEFYFFGGQSYLMDPKTQSTRKAP